MPIPDKDMGTLVSNQVLFGFTSWFQIKFIQLVQTISHPLIANIIKQTIPTMRWEGGVERYSRVLTAIVAKESIQISSCCIRFQCDTRAPEGPE
ncbi:hypothetical protein CEXT_267091 [Caerostris extrusa]|uniref:Uncharacterized protein n=1 Tax=Caerostris extrusa TaxID=172846 RepID=A0AAV4U3I9_CAEEX|nr:hypothetical protein CEXT_267091 [Caerostris extrusa]